jgi:hypothetical protein
MHAGPAVLPKSIRKERSVRDHRRGKRGLSANQWWHYSEGLKDVVREFAALCMPGFCSAADLRGNVERSQFAF